MYRHKPLSLYLQLQLQLQSLLLVLACKASKGVYRHIIYLHS